MEIHKTVPTVLIIASELISAKISPRMICNGAFFVDAILFRLPIKSARKKEQKL